MHRGQIQPRSAAEAGAVQGLLQGRSCLDPMHCVQQVLGGSGGRDLHFPPWIHPIPSLPSHRGRRSRTPASPLSSFMFHLPPPSFHPSSSTLHIAPTILHPPSFTLTAPPSKPTSTRWSSRGGLCPRCAEILHCPAPSGGVLVLLPELADVLHTSSSLCPCHHHQPTEAQAQTGKTPCACRAQILP